MTAKFCDRIKKLRKSVGLSQKDAAARLGVSQALLSHYENGIRECGLDFTVKLAALYGVSCDYILGVKQEAAGLPDEVLALAEIMSACENMEEATAKAIKNAAALCVSAIADAVTNETSAPASLSAAGVYLAGVKENLAHVSKSITAVNKTANEAAGALIK